MQNEPVSPCKRVLWGYEGLHISPPGMVAWRCSTWQENAEIDPFPYMMSFRQDVSGENEEKPLSAIENPTRPVYNMSRGDSMSMAEEIMQVVAALHDEQKQTVLDFARFLREKEAHEVSAMMKDIVDENLEAFKELAK